MSWDFSLGTGRGQADFGASGISYPITIGAWIKATSHDATTDHIASIARNTTDNNGMIRIQQHNATNEWAAQAVQDDGGAGNAANKALDITSAGWVGVMGHFTGTDSTENLARYFWIQARANTNSNLSTRTIAGVLRYVACGASYFGSLDFQHKIAHVAIWSSINGGSLPSDAQIDSWMDGTNADNIAPSALKAWWPLNENSTTQTDQSGNGVTMTMVTNRYSTDDPVFSENITIPVPTGPWR